MVQRVTFTGALALLFLLSSGQKPSDGMRFPATEDSQKRVVVTRMPIDSLTGTPIPRIAEGDSAILSAIDSVHREFRKTDSLSNLLQKK